MASQDPHQPLLCQTLRGSEGGILSDTTTCRRYVGRVDMRMQLAGVPESTTRTVMYEVQARTKAGPHAHIIRNVRRADLQLHAPVAVPASVQQDFEAYAKKYTNFTATHKTMDLAAVGYILAQALARYVQTGHISCRAIRLSNARLLIRALSVRDDPVGSSVGAVFIPRVLGVDDLSSAFYALCAAVNRCGVTVFTDYVSMDGANAPIMCEPQDSELAIGIVMAMRILLGMYNNIGMGAVMALAITKGIHTTLSVVGHTDEGAFMRDALRANGYCAPYGAILINAAANYGGIPMPNVSSVGSFTVVVDSIALLTAAAVAHADPLVELNGRKYATVYSAGAIKAGGQTNEPTEADRRIICNKIVNDSGRVGLAYVRALARVFCVTGGEEIAGSMMACGIARAARPANRHLAYSSVAPWFWIEPTTLFSQNIDTPAERAGFAQLACTTAPSQGKIFEDLNIRGQDGEATDVAVQWRSARTVGLIHFLQGNRRDGLAAVIPTVFVADNIVHPGRLVNGVAAARAEHADVSNYLWVRGQSPFPAPSEMAYTGNHMALTLLHLSGPDFWQQQDRAAHVPWADELSGMITYTASTPVRINNGPANSPGAQVRRCRTQATDALDSARQSVASSHWRTFRGRAWGEGEAEIVVTATTRAPAPTFVPDINNVYSTEVKERERADAPPAVFVLQDGPGKADARTARDAALRPHVAQTTSKASGIVSVAASSASTLAAPAVITASETPRPEHSARQTSTAKVASTSSLAYPPVRGLTRHGPAAGRFDLTCPGLKAADVERIDAYTHTVGSLPVRPVTRVDVALAPEIRQAVSVYDLGKVEEVAIDDTASAAEADAAT